MKFKSIIIEGADQQGKTNLCAALSHALNWKIESFKKVDSNFDYFQGYVLEPETIGVVSFLTEIVNSQIEKRACKIKSTLELEKLMPDTLLILVDRFDSFVFDPKKESLPYADILKARLLFRQEFTFIHMPKIVVNTCKPQYLDNLINYITQ